MRLAIERRRPTLASSIFSSGNAGWRVTSVHRPTTSAVFSVRQRKPVLASVGATLALTDAPIADSVTQVRQGVLEGANVQPVTEMTQMIDVQRSYETIASLMQAQGEQEKNMIAKLSNITA